jgi:hypothetical protein
MPNILKNILNTYKESSDFTSSHNSCRCNLNFHKIVKNLNAFIQGALSKSKSQFNISISPYFNIGFLILTSALGGNKFKTLVVLENLHNFSRNNKYIEFDKLNFCCLLHFLLSLESSCSILASNKMKISNFITRSKYSDNFFDFLCKTLSFSGQFDETYRLTIINHPWIKINNFINLNNNNSKVKISFKEMIKIVREGKSSKNFGQDFVNIKNFSNFLNSIEIILYNNHFIDREELSRVTQFKKNVIKELSRESGVNRNEIIERIQNRINTSQGL